MLVAFGLLLLVEVWVRLQAPADIIPYSAHGRLSYSSIRHYLNRVGAAEVTFIGSSRTREGINCPMVRYVCEQALGRDVEVANYSAPGLSADESLAIVDRILGQPKKPRVLLYGVTPLQLSAVAHRSVADKKFGELWYLNDWWREGRGRGRLEYDVLPDVIRNEIGDLYYTFGYREKAVEYFGLGHNRNGPNPIVGDASRQQTIAPDNSLIEIPRTEEDVLTVLGRRLRKGRYRFSTEAGECVAAIIDRCTAHDVPVVIFEVPLSGIMLRVLPDDTMRRFRRQLRAICESHGALYLTVDDYGVTYDDSHFRDTSHMNLPGARILSQIIARDVIAPVLRGEEVDMRAARAARARAQAGGEG